MNKTKFRVEYLIYLFLLLTPFLDAASFLFRKYVPTASISPSTVLRPIIPCILLLYIFMKDKQSRKILPAFFFLYTIYALGHLIVFNSLHTDFNAGGVLNEAQYVLNYTYMISLFYSFYWFQKNKGLPKLQKYMTLMLVLYLALIYLAIITGTSSTTYIDGVGFKGWNASGNGLSAIFILGMCGIFTYLLKYISKWYVWIYLFGLFYYLLMLFGTRTAFFGSILVVIVYGFSTFFLYMIHQHKFKPKHLIFVLCIIVLLGTVSVVGGASVLKRRQNMKELENTIIDPLTNKTAHLTGDLTNFIVEIKNEEESIQMSNEQKLALLKTYQMANKLNVLNSNRRKQQLIYHHYLFKEEFSISTVLFGTGYLNNYPELTLEMELPAFFYNFGLLGFLIYFGPFFILLIKMLIFFFKRLKDIKVDYMMYLFGALLSVVLSLLTGYVYFYVSSMLIVICLFILLLQEREAM